MERILVVDDDRSTRELIRLQLRQRGYRVDTAAGGATALKRLGKGDHDLMLLDIRMPGIDGLGVLRQMRSLSRRPKVIVMTADDTPETLFEAIREHTQRYLKKPLEFETLTTLVREVLDSSEAPPIEVISAKPDWVELVVPCDRGAAARIQAVLGQLETDLPEDSRGLGDRFMELAEADRQLVTGALEQAIDLYSQMSDLCRRCGLALIGRAHFEANRPDSAIAVFTRLVETPDLFRVNSDGGELGPTYERLARLHDERGDLDEAAKYYAALVELWAEADQELQPRVRAAQARLEEILQEIG